MDPVSIVPWVIAAFIFLFFTLSAYGKKRSEDFHRFARRKGMSFVKKSDLAALEQLNNLELIPDNRINTASNIIRGDVDGVSVMICDLHVTKATGNPTMSTYKTGQTVFILQRDQINLPFFIMYPAGFANKMLHTSGKKNIDFPSHPEFFRTYVLKSDDEIAVRKSFHDQALAFFVNHGGLNIEGRRNRLLYFRRGTFIKPAELNAFLSESLTIFRMFA